MIDYHSHILPGIDDGPATQDESLAMAAALSSAGFTEVYCTPHRIRGSYDATSDQVRSAVAALQSELDRAGIPLLLHPGREHYLDEYLLDIITSDPLPLGDTGMLLVELPSQCDPERVKQVCFQLISRYRVLIAHPERSHQFAQPFKPGRSGLMGMLQNFLAPAESHAPRQESLLDYTRTIGCSFQANLGSFAGYYGDRVRMQARQLSSTGTYTHYGSDAHSSGQLIAILSRPLPDGMA